MKRKIALILAMAMAAFLFAACSPVTQNNNDPDGVSSASYPATEEDVHKAAGKDGTWIVILEGDMTLEKDLVFEGEFTNRDVVDRKLALYSQDSERNITAQFTLTAPRLIVRSENFRLQGGTFKGDVYVEANGFKLLTATIDGNLYFASEDVKATSEIGEDSEVTGEISIQSLD